MILLETVRGRVSLQDAGRPGQRAAGVPLGGFADATSATLANRLVGNPVSAPVLEFALAGGRVQFQAAGVVAWTGAAAELRLDGALVRPDRGLRVDAGQCLDIGAFAWGRYGYLAVGGHWDVPRFRGSVSPLRLGEGVWPAWPQSGGDGWLRAGTSVPIDPTAAHLTWVAPPRPRGALAIEIVAGPEGAGFAEALTGPFRDPGSHGWPLLDRVRWRVGASSDRMGVRLSPSVGYAAGAPLPTLAHSGPVFPGVVQGLPDGSLVVLHVDAATVGGYARVGWVARPDLDALAQARPGTWVRVSFCGSATVASGPGG